jgi:putative transposase
LTQVIYGMLVMTGRVTMLGLSRWTEKGGSYRSIQRFYHSIVPWTAIQWTFFVKQLWQATDEYFIAGDEVVVSKAGKKTHGLDRFFSGVQQKVIPGLSFFALSLVNVREERSYPLQVTQTVKSAEEKAASKARVEAKKAHKAVDKRPSGRPKGSRNKDKQTVVLNPDLLRIQACLQMLLKAVCATLSLKYVVMDGHFGNYPSAYMVRQTKLDLISKLRSDAALYLPFAGEYRGHGPRPKYGARIDVRHMDTRYLKETTIDRQLRTDIYQVQCLNKEFAFPLNVIVIVKTNLQTGAQAHVILFSTDLQLACARLVKFYSLRFQIEFNFRDAKQYWGLEDFMNVKEGAVTNAVNQAFFMVNLSAALLRPYRQQNPDYSILDLKAHYRGHRYVGETIKMLLKKPDEILLQDIFHRIARLGAIHPLFQHAVSP